MDENVTAKAPDDAALFGPDPDAPKPRRKKHPIASETVGAGDTSGEAAPSAKLPRVAVIGADDDAVNARVRKLRADGHTCRGLALQFWRDEPEFGFHVWHVIAATRADADALKARVLAAHELHSKPAPEVVCVVA